MKNTSFLVRHRHQARNAWSINETLQDAQASRTEALQKWPQYDFIIVKREIIDTIVE